MSNTSEKQNQQTQNMFNEWIKATQLLWRPLADMQAFDQAQEPGTGPKETGKQDPDKRRLEKLWASNLKAWQTVIAQGMRPENAESLLKSTQLLPELSGKLMQVGFSGVTHLQQQWVQRLSRLHEMDGNAQDAKELDRKFLQRWTDWYENEIQQFFNMPQLGLTRFYQEKFNQAVDKYHQLQTTMGEFLHLIYLPVEQSVKELQDQLTEMAQKADLPEDSKIYYNEWVKILEGHYMKLFQSEEYVQSLSKTINALNEYVRARSTVLEDALKALPIPTNSDMDELYQELYHLKRRVRALEKQSTQQAVTS